MDIANIALQGASAGTSITTERNPQSQLGKDAFLQILVAQLRSQDPLSGGDSSQYVSQMAQFSTLEQMQNMNDTLSDLLSFQYIQYGSQLVGKGVALTDGEQQVRGVVERVRFGYGDIEVIVNGTPYRLSEVEELYLPDSSDEAGAAGTVSGVSGETEQGV